MPPAKIETLMMALKENINALIDKHPHFKKDLNKLIVRSESMSESQLLILTQRLDDFLQIDEWYFAWKKQNEWMLQIEPKLFAKAMGKYSELVKKFIHSKQLDEIEDTTWKSLIQDLHITLEQLSSPIEHVKKEFLKHFGTSLKEDAELFFDNYTGFMDKLAEQKEQILVNSDGGIDKTILDAEIDKQIKLVQAQIILAMSAATIEEKATHLKLAGSALFGISLTLSGAGAGVAVVGLAGSVVPVIGTIIGGTVGLIGGGIIGAVKGYHAYKEAKQKYQEQLASTFREPHHQFEKAVSINVGIASIKTREAFDWLMKGPHLKDYDRMIYQYKSANVMCDEQQIDDLKIRLRSEFAASRGTYFSMLRDLIRASIADSALMAAAGLEIVPPFDDYSAIDIATQFTKMCYAQLGVARAMGGLDPDPQFLFDDHIDVQNSKELAYTAATQLASNAESLTILLYQIALCIHLDESIRKELLDDIHDLLAKTIDIYDEVVRTNPGLDLKSNLGEALLAGIFGDLENMGEMKKPRNHNTKEYKAYSSALDYMRHKHFHREHHPFNHKQSFVAMKEKRTKTGADIAETILNVMIVTGVEVFHGPSKLVHTPLIEIAVGGALAGLALAVGAGAYYLNAKAKKSADQLNIFGSVSKRRDRLHDTLRAQVELAYLTENRLHTLTDAPDTLVWLDRSHHEDTLVKTSSKVGTEKQTVKNTGWSGSLVTTGQKKQGVVVLEKLNEALESLKDVLLFHPFEVVTSDRDYSNIVDIYYKRIMALLHAINKSSKIDRLDLPSEKDIIQLLRESLKELHDISSKFSIGYKKNFLEQKNHLIEKELNKLEQRLQYHLKVASEEPRNFKAIAIDSKRMDEKLTSLIRLIKNDHIKSPHRRTGHMNSLLDEIKLIIERQLGALPERTNIELVQQAYELMKSKASLPSSIAQRLTFEPMITPKMIHQLISRQRDQDMDEINGITFST